MQLEISFSLLLVFIIIYFCLIKFYSVLFRITGLTREKSTFQVISLLTTAGFTTNESELIVKDKIRRRIAIAAMITGNAFSVIIVSLIISLFSNITQKQEAETLHFIFAGSGIFICLFVIYKLPFIHKIIDKVVEKLAHLLISRNNKENVITVLDNLGKVAIAEVYIRTMPDVMDGKSLIDSGLKDKYGINVLMVKRGNKTLNVSKDTIFQIRDCIIVFGIYQNILDLFSHIDSKAHEIVENSSELKINTLNLIDNYGKQAMVEIKINSLPTFMENKTLSSCGLKEKYNINVMTIRRDDDVIELTKDTIIKKDDSIVVFGDYQKIKDVFIHLSNI